MTKRVPVFRSALAFLLALACLMGAGASASPWGGYENFRTVAVYTDGLFADVVPGAWYYDYVAAVYALGLMQGDGAGSFNVEGNVRISETLALACRLHSQYYTGSSAFQQGEPWYQVYVDYALANGLISSANLDYEAAATRSQFAAILARAMPEEALPAINDVADNQIPDVKLTSANATEIYRLYRAGVLTGNNSRGTFTPETPIQRSAVATILARMVYRSLRQKYQLQPPAYPDLTEQPAADDTFFSTSAMLGNSLVQGMSLYSGLSAVSWYCKEGASVNDTRGKVDELLQHQYDRVYIEFGINEIYLSPESFTTSYGAIIDRIRNVMPDVEIYVMAVTPVTRERDAGGSFTMARIRSFNSALYTMCRDKNCWYLDICTPLEDSDGFLRADYAGWDGSPHLSSSGYQAWENILRTHYD